MSEAVPTQGWVSYGWPPGGGLVVALLVGAHLVAVVGELLRELLEDNLEALSQALLVTFHIRIIHL